jgi:hypothetical protein
MERVSEEEGGMVEEVKAAFPGVFSLFFFFFVNSVSANMGNSKMGIFNEAIRRFGRVMRWI